LCVLYAAERTGVPAPLPVYAPQYTDYVQWQAEMLAGPEGERLWTYWRQELAGELSLLNLPVDRPRPPVQTYRGASHVIELGEAFSKQLKALAQSEKATLYMVLVAAFETLLFRYTGQDDIRIGTTMAGRSRADLQKIVGYLANPVVLRAHFADDLTFKGLLGQVRYKVIAALEHQDYPFPLLVERLQPKRDASYLPLLTETEQQQFLVEWNDTKSDYPANLCIHQLFESQVQQTPEATAVVFEGNELTYRELNRRANVLAHTLQMLGVGPDVLVSVC